MEKKKLTQGEVLDNIETLWSNYYQNEGDRLTIDEVRGEIEELMDRLSTPKEEVKELPGEEKDKTHDLEFSITGLTDANFQKILAIISESPGGEISKNFIRPIDPTVSKEGDILQALEESLETLKWMFDNMKVDNPDLKSDAFNIPANTISRLETILTGSNP
jgi:hypothetical protein